LVPSPLKLAVRLLVVAAALSAAVVTHPAPAAAASPCWKALLNDWYDGRIDHTYPVHCYQDALHHLPADVQTYSSAHDDIQRALQSAEAKIRKSGGTVSANSEVPPAAPTETSGHGGDQGNSSTTTTTAGSPGKTTPGGLSGAAQDLNPSSASSVPLPLIILGALALLLVAAGAAGLIAKRVQANKQKPS
jgi:hypothetical protein